MFIPITLGRTRSTLPQLVCCCQSHPGPQGGHITGVHCRSEDYVVNFHISDIVNNLSDDKNEFIYDAESSKDITTQWKRSIVSFNKCRLSVSMSPGWV